MKMKWKYSVVLTALFDVALMGGAALAEHPSIAVVPINGPTCTFGPMSVVVVVIVIAWVGLIIGANRSDK